MMSMVIFTPNLGVGSGVNFGVDGALEIRARLHYSLAIFGFNGICVSPKSHHTIYWVLDPINRERIESVNGP